MTAEKRSWTKLLVQFVGEAALLALLAACRRQTSADNLVEPKPSTEPTRSMRPDLVTYGVGYSLALTLTSVAFALVHWRWADPSSALAIVFSLALVQIVVHFRCFLHVTLRGPARDDLQLILFSTLIVLLMVGGTLVVLFNLRMRMM